LPIRGEAETYFSRKVAAAFCPSGKLVIGGEKKIFFGLKEGRGSTVLGKGREGEGRVAFALSRPLRYLEGRKGGKKGEGKGDKKKVHITNRGLPKHNHEQKSLAPLDTEPKTKKGKGRKAIFI